MSKWIKIVFKNGVTVETPYSFKIYDELKEKMGKVVKKDNKAVPNIVEAKNFNLDATEVIGIFYELKEDKDAAVKETEEK